MICHMGGTRVLPQGLSESEYLATCDALFTGWLSWRRRSAFISRIYRHELTALHRAYGVHCGMPAWHARLIAERISQLVRICN